ncbi:MAG TPA: hypothetical protein DD640_08635 [Clostridiales bacterium]|nr:hypothetical protein [Clostridiales bacterium]
MREDIRYLTAEGSLPFVVEMAGTSYCDGTYRIFRQQSPVFVFEYVLQGTGTVIEDQQMFYPGPGDVYILHAHCRHEYYADPADPWVKVWFNIRGPAVEALLQAYQMPRVNWVRHCPAPIADLFERFLQITRTAQPLPQLFDQCALVFHEIVAALARQIRPGSPEQNEAAYLRDYIHAHMTDPLTVADLARLIYRSPAYTIRLFRETFQITPYAYLAQCRVTAAKQMLAGTQLPIQVIASQLCYADSRYFAHVFRQNTDQTPRQYRLASRKERLSV